MNAPTPASEIRCECTVTKLRKQEEFEVETNEGTFTAPSFVVASGGLSIKPLGATDFGYQIAKQSKLNIERPRPGLVPFTLDPIVLERLAKLSGVQ